VHRSAGRTRWMSAVIAVAAVVTATPDLYAPVHRKMVELKTDHYRIRTDDDPRILSRIAAHMERMWWEYYYFCNNFADRHQGKSARKRRVTITLYRTRRDYGSAEDSGTGGVSKGDDIYTFLEGRTWQSLLPLLQHEGWHSFLAEQVEAGVPPWANEGLAEFFENASYKDDRWHYRPMSAAALGDVLNAMRRAQTYSLEALLRVNGADWLRAIERGTPLGRRQYAQARALVEFLLRSEDCRYAPQFMDFMNRMSKRRKPLSSFRKVYGRDIDAIQRFWLRYMDDPTAGTPRIERVPTPDKDEERCSEHLVILAKIMLRWWPKAKDWPTSADELYKRLMRPERSARWATTDLAGRIIFSHHTGTLRQICRCPALKRRQRGMSYRLVPRDRPLQCPDRRAARRTRRPKTTPQPESQPPAPPNRRPRRTRDDDQDKPPRNYPLLVCDHHPGKYLVVQCELLEGVYFIRAYTKPKPPPAEPGR